MQPESAVLLLNLILLVIAYFWVYPKFCGANLTKLVINDLLAIIVVLIIVGYHFWGSGVAFSLLVTEVNWFWFTFITYTVMEIPLIQWYFKKYKVM